MFREVAMSYVEDFAERANEKLLDHEVFKLATGYFNRLFQPAISISYFKRMQDDGFGEVGRAFVRQTDGPARRFVTPIGL
jgi:hypothetical protein